MGGWAHQIRLLGPRCPWGMRAGMLERSVLTSLHLDGQVAAQISSISGPECRASWGVIVAAKLVELKIIIQAASSPQPVAPTA